MLTGTLELEATPALVALFPEAKTINGKLFVEHTPRTTIPLRAMGITVPSSVLTNYDWCGGKPFEVQRRTVESMTENPRSFVLNSMGTGKTRCALWAFDYLKKLGIVNKMLVVCPISTMTFTWGSEVLRAVPHLRWTVLHGTRAKRLDRLADTGNDIYIINHDGLSIIARQLARRRDIDVLVLDELAVYRNPVERTKLVARVAERFPVVWGMTGAPMPNEVTDVYNEIKIIAPHRVPKYFSHFRDELMYRINQFKFLPKVGAVEKALDYFQPAVRYTLDDIMELPGFSSQTIETPLGKEQDRVYHDLRKHASAMVANGTITALNAGANMGKLLQASTGWIYDSKKQVHKLDGGARLQALTDLIDATPHKVIVFCNFLHTLHGVSSYLENKGYEIGVIHGGTGHTERTRIFNAFQNQSALKVLAAHPRCISHGLTLTAADTVIWFGPPLSAETYDQANARIRRVGQKNRQLFAHLKSTPMEGRVYNLLINKLLQQDSFLALLEDASWG